MSIESALDAAMRWGQIDGSHHRLWVIDQMVRHLTECPIVQREAIGGDGKPYTYEALGESDAYLEFVRQAKDGKDGPDSYEWDCGVPP